MKLFDSHKAYSDDFNFHFFIKILSTFTMIFPICQKPHHIILKDKHILIFDQMYYFWALANRFWKIHVPGWFQVYIQKNWSCIDSHFYNFLKSFANGNSNNQKVFSTYKGWCLKTRYEKKGGIQNWKGIQENEISLNHNTYNIQPGFEHLIPVPTIFWSKSIKY